MDEPFIGLFDPEIDALMNYLQQIKEHTTIVIISNSEDVQRRSDRTIYLENGQAVIK